MTEVIAIFRQVYSQVKKITKHRFSCLYGLRKTLGVRGYDYLHAGCVRPKETHRAWFLGFFSSAYSIFLVILLFTTTVNAIENISIDVEQIDTKDWTLKDVSLSLFDLDKQSHQLALSIKQISLPEPFTDIKVFDIQCLSFTWQENKIDCQKGEALFKSEHFDHSPFALSFSITEKHSHFSIQNLKFANGVLSLNAKEEGGNWLVTIKSQGLKLHSLAPFLSKIESGIEDISSGYVNADIKLRGNSKGLNKIWLKTLLRKVTLQGNQGQLATESLSFKLDLFARLKNGEWQWENNNHILQGEFYIDPVYMEIKDEGLRLKAKGLWLEQGDIILQQAMVTHPDVVELNMEGVIKHKPAYFLDKTRISVRIKDLDHFSDQYILPFIEQTAFEGIKLNGQLDSEIELNQSIIKKVFVNFKNLTVTDDKKRIAIEKADGVVNWSVKSDFIKPTHIRWDKLKIKAIPIEAGQLKLLLRKRDIQLLEQSSIPLLGGELDIKQFNWHQTAEDEPKVFFEGGVKHVSLEQLSQAFDWTPLSGNISGYIPGVDYEHKKLTVNGELKVNVFDGTVKINKLASSGLFTDFSKFYMNMEIDNLDLHMITQKFQMGGMEGRVSGFVNNLYLENWEPVTFYAWLGTPENDESRHRISQKAVENIASIGGGGAADVISKGFLRFFDSFGYDRLGFGCYLYEGVCQLMGVEAAEKGYYIIKGGGIPRIDIVGYNPQVDWKVLMERLSRISATDEVVIQ